MTLDELVSWREELFKHSGMPWEKLKELGESFQLDDQNYNIYRSIKSINWVLEGK